MCTERRACGLWHEGKGPTRSVAFIRRLAREQSLVHRLVLRTVGIQDKTEQQTKVPC